jgi:hypothetical protein
MSIATLRERIIAELRIAHEAGRTYPAPVAWDLDSPYGNAKTMAEAFARAIIPEVSVTQVLDIPMLETEDFPDALPDTIRIFADTSGRVLKRNPSGLIEEIYSTDYRP